MSIVQLETLVGTEVRDATGKLAGRLEEVHADWQGEECIVTHYVLASRHARRGISLTDAITFVLRLLGAEKAGGSIVVPWDKLDLSDPEKPRLKCRAEELV